MTKKFLKTLLARLNERKNYELIMASGFFDEIFYTSVYPDVQSAEVDPLLHFIRYGAKEGRWPSASFDLPEYLRANPLVALQEVNPVIDWLTSGRVPPRSVAPKVETKSASRASIKEWGTLNKAGQQRDKHGWLGGGRRPGKRPYAEQPDRAFWRRAVAAEHVTQIKELFDGIPDYAEAKFATAGSCFAQHLGKALKTHGLHYMDYEPAPPFLTEKAESLDTDPPFSSAADVGTFGYGVYSCRYGNIYSVRQLRQLIEEAFGRRRPVDAIWSKGDRYFDALRPGIEPDGFGSPEEVTALRGSHLSRVRALLTDLDIFVFTLGLTETWVSIQDETAYPIVPGVIAGEYDPAKYRFVNFRYNDIYEDMLGFIEALRAINPSARLLLTVSPVPLAATATGNHVLVATTYSKSVLRSVAGDLATDVGGVYYFPSYEVITGQPTRHMYYNPDLRTVCQVGVEEVMRHFFKDPVSLVTEKPLIKRAPASPVGFEHCEEALLDTRSE